MSETQWKYHPKNPANQPFVGAGRKNQSKKNSWWAVGSPKYWRNAGKKTSKKSVTTEE